MIPFNRIMGTTHGKTGDKDEWTKPTSSPVSESSSPESTHTIKDNGESPDAGPIQNSLATPIKTRARKNTYSLFQLSPVVKDTAQTMLKNLAASLGLSSPSSESSASPNPDQAIRSLPIACLAAANSPQQPGQIQSFCFDGTYDEPRRQPTRENSTMEDNDPFQNPLRSYRNKEESPTSFTERLAATKLTSQSPTHTMSDRRADKMAVESQDSEMPDTVYRESNNLEQAVGGCERCTVEAVCCTVHAERFRGTDPNDLPLHAKRERYEFASMKTDEVLDQLERNELASKAKKGKIVYDDDPDHEGPFCCNNLKYDARRSCVTLTPDKLALILQFLLSANNPTEIRYLDNVTADDLYLVERLFKVNIIKNDEEQQTWLFTPSVKSQELPKYFCVGQVDRAIPFKNMGSFEWGRFWCKKHQLGFKIGVEDRVVAEVTGHWATFGDYRIDRLMRLPLKGQFLI